MKPAAQQQGHVMAKARVARIVPCLLLRPPQAFLHAGGVGAFGDVVLGYGATHARAEVFLPGAGWKGFDPSIGEIVGSSHIAVAVARLPESVPLVPGAFVGPPGARLDVACGRPS